MKTFEYTAVVWKEKKGFVSKCPELGVASCGDTFEEAVNNLKEAVELYIENAKEIGLMEAFCQAIKSSKFSILLIAQSYVSSFPFAQQWTHLSKEG